MQKYLPIGLPYIRAGCTKGYRWYRVCDGSDDVVGSYMAAHAQEVTADLQGSNRPRKSLAAPSTRDPPRHPPQ